MSARADESTSDSELAGALSSALSDTELSSFTSDTLDVPFAKCTQCATADSAKDGVHLVSRLFARRARSYGQNRLAAAMP